MINCRLNQTFIWFQFIEHRNSALGFRKEKFIFFYQKLNIIFLEKNLKSPPFRSIFFVSFWLIGRAAHLTDIPTRPIGHLKISNLFFSIKNFERARKQKKSFLQIPLFKHSDGWTVLQFFFNSTFFYQHKRCFYDEHKS